MGKEELEVFPQLSGHDQVTSVTPWAAWRAGYARGPGTGGLAVSAEVTGITSGKVTISMTVSRYLAQWSIFGYLDHNADSGALCQ